MPEIGRPFVFLDGNLLEIFANDPSAKPLEERTLSEEDFQEFRKWIDTYRNCLRKSDEAEVLLRVGREMYDWLNGASGAMERLLDDGGPPAVVEFRIPKRRPRPGNPKYQNELTFLEVPWELLAEDGLHLAGDDYTQFCPVRRIGTPEEPKPPSQFRLSAVFMAAEPRDTHAHLRYEAEETAVMTATGDIGMDLVVEESGALDQLRQRLARVEADLLHLSCHGHNEPAPVLALEDERGFAAHASPADLNQTLADHRPKLLFLSACLTAASGPGNSAKTEADGESGGDALVNSFAASMIQFGCPAVLGWAGSVSDAGATRFAEKLYGDLATSNALETAAARARAALLNPGDAAKPDSRPSRDWHLARLWLGPAGGAALCAGDRARRLVPHDRGHREFLDTVNKQVPVAGYAEFVGRRRQIQDVLREFRAPTRAGALIHGFGGQGKSSLAARIANRLGDRRTVVVFGAENEKHRYRADKILQAVAKAYEHPAVNAIVDEHAAEVRKNPAALTPALRAILNGPCADPADGVAPMLLIVDDLEKVLVPPVGDGLHTVETDCAAGLCALIRAFDGAETRSRLLITSRYEFALAGGLEDRLLSLHLPPMRRYERDKQADAKLRALGPAAGAADRDGRSKLFETVIEAARGNPRLQDLLFTLAVESPDACERALARMKAELAGTAAEAGPDGAAKGETADPATAGADTEAERALIGFFQGLAVRGLVELLRPVERDLLQASAVFGVPVPMAVFGALADGAEAAGRRLLSLTLWDRFEDMVNPETAAVAVNGLARGLAFGAGDWKIPEPDEELADWVAGAVLPGLFGAWGGADGKRPYPADWQLAVLGVRAKDTAVIKATAKDAVTWLEKEFRYREAAELSEKSVAILEGNGVAVPPHLLMKANEVLVRVGNVELAGKCIEKAVRVIREKTAETDVSDFDLGSALLRHGRLLVDQGHIETALAAFEEAKSLFQAGGFQKDTAIVTGDIARIRADKGEVDAAMELHQERLEVYEALGDRRSRAVTLGDIARIRADKGEVDAAMELFQEKLEVAEALGDRRSRAVTLGDIARIRAGKGEVDAAMELHNERLEIFEALGDRRSRAVTLGDIARIRADKGEVDAAMELHNEMLEIFEALGDRRSRAVTLGDIARIRADKGEVDAAMELHQERLEVYEALGDRRSRAVTLGDIARIRAGKGEVDAAMELHYEEMEVYEALGDRRSRAVTLGDIARIRAGKGEVDAAMELHYEEMEVYEALGDRRSRAVTLGDIANILEAKGEVEKAMKLHFEGLEVYETLGDRHSKAITLWDIGNIQKNRGDRQSALQHIAESYQILAQLGDAAGLSIIGEVFGQMLLEDGDTENGMAVLQLSRDVYLKLGQPDNAREVEGIIAQFSK